MVWRVFKIKLKRLYRYEYWPYLMFYFPMFFYGVYLALRSGSLVYWSPANPSMKHGGVMGLSKYEILQKINGEYVPKTILVKSDDTFKDLKSKLLEVGIIFPLIAKPDIGERGKVVEKLNNEHELSTYLQKTKEDVLLQEYINSNLELGVLYYRFPNEPKGHISSVTQKEFLKITGDGKSTIEQLIDKDIRAYGRKEYLKNKFRDTLHKVLNAEETLLLEPIGNHNRGTIFLNGNHLINEDLERVFDRITMDMEGFYYGRFDIKTSSYESLYNGKNIKILELNGVSSEPAHVYDPQMNLFKAYRDIVKHMKIIYKISMINIQKGHTCSTAKSFFADLLHHFQRNRRRRKVSLY